ncbi:DUF3108 domain-containing protein [Ramlibacter sp. WS9]|uniref:DUF3108 domain-containing protein n=1 Tax=Ramlibacter sp. WS9 TaxID=1882741 RepID=UPI001142DFC3|nr:DUF3108 domain-containing protein [Ramlibacter sp. WS9]ROZ79626.1 DUF3108 domain-containing protein [Ramlibacter sp. WS9]
MAGLARLSHTGRRLLALLVAVLVFHGLVLQWLARELESPPRLRPLAAPMFTRLLRPETVTVPPQAVVHVAPRPKPRRVAVAAIDNKPAPVPAAPSASAPAPPASSPVTPPPPEPVPPAAQETVAAANAPGSPASAAVGALDSWPADTRLNYRLGGYWRGDLHGNARVQWQRQEGNYQTRVEIDLTVLSVSMTSQGEVTPQGLAPKAYEESQPNRTRGVRLGAEAIVLHDGRNVPRPAGVQDTASQFVELSHRFSSGQETLEVGRSVSFWMARPGAVDLWTYDVVARETLQLPELGPIEAFHLKPRPIANPRGNITAEMWFAPSLQYLPVRIRVKMGDEAHLDLMVLKIEQR